MADSFAPTASAPPSVLRAVIMRHILGTLEEAKVVGDDGRGGTGALTGLATLVLPILGLIAGGFLGFAVGRALEHGLFPQECTVYESGCWSELAESVGLWYGSAFGLLLGLRTAKMLRARYGPSHPPAIRYRPPRSQPGGAWQPVANANKAARRSLRYGILAAGLSLVPLFGVFLGWPLGVVAINFGLNARQEAGGASRVQSATVGAGLGMIAIGVSGLNGYITNQAL